MKFGGGIKAKQITKAEDALGPYLSAGEALLGLFKGGTKYSTELLAVTSSRVLEITAIGKINYEVNLAELDASSLAFDAKGSAVSSGLVAGGKVTWRFHNLRGSAEDRAAFVETLGAAIGTPHERHDGQKPRETKDVAAPRTGTAIAGVMPTRAAFHAIEQASDSPQERPWLIVQGTDKNQLMAAFANRLAILKIGTATDDVTAETLSYGHIGALDIIEEGREDVLVVTMGEEIDDGLGPVTSVNPGLNAAAGNTRRVPLKGVHSDSLREYFDELCDRIAQARSAGGWEFLSTAKTPIQINYDSVSPKIKRPKRKGKNKTTGDHHLAQVGDSLIHAEIEKDWDAGQTSIGFSAMTMNGKQSTLQEAADSLGDRTGEDRRVIAWDLLVAVRERGLELTTEMYLDMADILATGETVNLHVIPD